jgi:hypothetical protein
VAASAEFSDVKQPTLFVEIGFHTAGHEFIF